jgi:hypothetical protein
MWLAIHEDFMIEMFSGDTCHKSVVLNIVCGADSA